MQPAALVRRGALRALARARTAAAQRPLLAKALPTAAGFAFGGELRGAAKGVGRGMHSGGSLLGVALTWRARAAQHLFAVECDARRPQPSPPSQAAPGRPPPPPPCQTA